MTLSVPNEGLFQKRVMGNTLGSYVFFFIKAVEVSECVIAA
jgi:hypothetical protein